PTLHCLSFLRPPPPPPTPTPFPYTTLFRSNPLGDIYQPYQAASREFSPRSYRRPVSGHSHMQPSSPTKWHEDIDYESRFGRAARSEEHTSELQSRVDLVCRLLLEKKKKRSD